MLRKQPKVLTFCVLLNAKYGYIVFLFGQSFIAPIEGVEFLCSTHNMGIFCSFFISVSVHSYSRRGGGVEF